MRVHRISASKFKDVVENGKWQYDVIVLECIAFNEAWYRHLIYNNEWRKHTIRDLEFQ